MKRSITIAFASVGILIGILFTAGLVLTQVSPRERRILGFDIIFDTRGYITFLGTGGVIGFISPIVSLLFVVVGFAVGGIATITLLRLGRVRQRRGFEIRRNS